MFLQLIFGLYPLFIESLGCLATGSGTTGTGTVCPSGWQLFQANCYLARTTPMTWENAELDCVSMGAHLASVQNEHENNFIEMLTTTGSNQGFNMQTWIGGMRTGPGLNDFTWSDSSNFGFTRWYTANGEPNNLGGTEDCIELLSDNDTTGNGIGRWADYDCSTMMKYVCKRAAT